MIVWGIGSSSKRIPHTPLESGKKAGVRRSTKVSGEWSPTSKEAAVHVSR